MPVGMGGQLAGDLGFQGLDLRGQRGQRPVRAAVTSAWAAPSAPMAPGGAARSRARSTLAGAGRPRTGMARSHAPIACSRAAWASGSRRLPARCP